MLTVQIPHDLELRPYQAGLWKYLVTDGGRNATWIMHRRAGKDLVAINATVARALQRVGAYWHVYPTAAQARKAIWEGFRADGKGLIDSCFPRAIVKRVLEKDMVVELKNGSIWRLIGSDRVEMVGAGPAGMVFSEYALAKPGAWLYCSPMLEQSGGWVLFISTPRGRNHCFKQYEQAGQVEGAWRETVTLKDTGEWRNWKATSGLPYRSMEAFLDAQRQKGIPDAILRQEYLCDWDAALVGSVWGDLVEQVEKRGDVGAFEMDVGEVFTAWDLGMSDSTAVWFYAVGDGRVDVIDHLEAHGKPLSYYFDEIEARAYRYVKHWLPHDAKARTLASGVSVLEQFAERYGAGKVGIAPHLTLADGIQAVRWLLQRPLRFHERARPGIEALRQYHYGFDEETKAYSMKPEHDWSSHTADAFRYLSLAVKQSGRIVDAKKPKVVDPNAWMKGMRTLNDYTLDELWETAPKPKRERV